MLEQVNSRRRKFVFGAGGAVAAALVAPAAARTVSSKSDILLASTYVAGTAYHDGPRCSRQINIGDELILRRAPDNDYDPRTVEVLTRSGAKLGQIPGGHASTVASLMDGGFRPRAVVRSVVVGRRPDIRIDVTLLA